MKPLPHDEEGLGAGRGMERIRARTASRRFGALFRREVRAVWMAFAACVSALLLAGCVQPEVAVYPYEKPLTSPGEKFGGLPPAVQKTVRAQAGTAEIYDIRKTTHAGQVAYEVLFRQPELYPPLYVASDGSVLYPNLEVAVGAAEDPIGAMSGGAQSGLKFSDLPIAVGNTVLEKAPTAEVSFIQRIDEGGRTFYEVSFKNEERYPRMLISEDGELVQKIIR